MIFTLKSGSRKRIYVVDQLTMLEDNRYAAEERICDKDTIEEFKVGASGTDPASGTVDIIACDLSTNSCVLHHRTLVREGSKPIEV